MDLYSSHRKKEDASHQLHGTANDQLESEIAVHKQYRNTIDWKLFFFDSLGRVFNNIVRRRYGTGTFRVTQSSGVAGRVLAKVVGIRQNVGAHLYRSSVVSLYLVWVQVRICASSPGFRKKQFDLTK